MDRGKISLVPSIEGARRNPAGLKLLGKNGPAVAFLAGRGVDAFSTEEVEIIDTRLGAIDLAR